MFTCGQRYMKLASMRARRSPYIEKYIYILIGAAAIYNAFLNSRPHFGAAVITVGLAILFYLKCYSAEKTNMTQRKRDRAASLRGSV